MNRRSFWISAFFLCGMVTIATTSVAQAPPKKNAATSANDAAKTSLLFINAPAQKRLSLTE